VYAWKGERGKRMCMPGKERDRTPLSACLSVSLSPFLIYIFVFLSENYSTAMFTDKFLRQLGRVIAMVRDIFINMI
jgi:hypothetical protein